MLRFAQNAILALKGLRKKSLCACLMTQKENYMHGKRLLWRFIITSTNPIQNCFLKLEIYFACVANRSDLKKKRCLK